jgi:hypothetical protein
LGFSFQRHFIKPGYEKLKHTGTGVQPGTENDSEQKYAASVIKTGATYRYL